MRSVLESLTAERALLGDSLVLKGLVVMRHPGILDRHSLLKPGKK